MRAHVLVKPRRARRRARFPSSIGIGSNGCRSGRWCGPESQISFLGEAHFPFSDWGRELGPAHDRESVDPDPEGGEPARRQSSRDDERQGDGGSPIAQQHHGAVPVELPDPLIVEFERELHVHCRYGVVVRILDVEGDQDRRKRE